jgi:hypothetical protein
MGQRVDDLQKTERAQHNANLMLTYVQKKVF